MYDPGIDPVEVPYEGRTLPGYFHRAGDGVRPLLIMHTGFDGSAEEKHWSGARAAVERGYHVLCFDGPGQFQAAMERSPVARWSITHGMWCFGASSPSDYLRKTLDYTLAGGIAERIRCPTLVCDAEDDVFFQGQARSLFDHLRCKKTLLSFTASEGAGAHCEVGAARLANARMFDWLDETLGWEGEP
ncbi:alpha/beta hydrolase family protein [Bordetella bronchialis]|uniref:Peptidase S9 prolyl oligopeptidase catalytic domain-containing protein n=1 Tax=Bordetella bronchialis TaxID=463025 RepID=A0ABM6CN92_9BORD|nr:hypothetical protein [Bordetella bronchialis]ANN65415.1 hypothetical protein BAU06_03085 [Bordetella bronchialis]